MMNPTRFLEANALLHMQAKDHDAARTALAEMNPRELALLSLASAALQREIAREYERQTGEHIGREFGRENPYDDPASRPRGI